jgi:hypothetical protein
MGAFWRRDPQQEEWEFDVFPHRECRKEVEKLENVTQTLAPEGCQRVAAQECEVLSCDEDLAAVWSVDSAEAV